MSEAAASARALDPASVDGSGLSRLVWMGAGVGVAGLALALGVSGGGADFYFPYLVAYLFFLSIGLGSLFFVLCLFVTRAGWGVAIRRIVENGMATLPAFALLFIPVWLGRHELFPWLDPEVVAKSKLLQGKAPFLNEPFFMIRALFYFVAWSALATYFSRQSQRQDESGDPAISARLRSVSAPAIIVYALTSTFAAVDWIMSLTPEWYSTMIGVYFFAGSVLAAFAFAIVAVHRMQAQGLLQGLVTVEHVHDLGKLLFAFTVFWTYIGFSQYFLIWYANIPEETVYFMDRNRGTWPAVGKLLVVGHFVIPFFFLMPRAIKRDSRLLVAGALWLLAMHFFDVYWCVMPVHRPDGAQPGIVDLGAMLAVGGFFLAAFGWISSRRALVPLKDPRLPESLTFQNVF
jgi:hypothetical protein